MRKSLNNNPIVAIAIVGVLGVGVAFLLLSSMSQSGSSSTSTTATTSTTSALPGATAPTAAAPTTSVPATAAATPTAPPATGAVDPTTGLPVAPAAAPTPPTTVGSFAAGPGLPKAVVDAYKGGNAVALLIVKRDGIDDRDVQRGYRSVKNMKNVTSFEVLAQDVARYARLTEGVDLDRAPALVVLRPRSLTGSGPPKATVTYGFNRPEQLTQAVRDALYKGPENLPYHPN
jgi:hypothetical protein